MAFITRPDGTLVWVDDPSSQRLLAGEPGVDPQKPAQAPSGGGYSFDESPGPDIPPPPPPTLGERVKSFLPTLARVGSGIVAAPGGWWGAGVGGAGEAVAELLEGKDPFTQRGMTRIATEAGIGAIPLAKVFKVGKVAESAIRGAMHAGGAEAAREAVEQDTGYPINLRAIDPTKVATSAAIGGVTGGGLAKLLGVLEAPATAARPVPTGKARLVSPEGLVVKEAEVPLGKMPGIKGQAADVQADIKAATEKQLAAAEKAAQARNAQIAADRAAAAKAEEADLKMREAAARKSIVEQAKIDKEAARQAAAAAKAQAEQEKAAGIVGAFEGLEGDKAALAAASEEAKRLALAKAQRQINELYERARGEVTPPAGGGAVPPGPAGPAPTTPIVPEQAAPAAAAGAPPQAPVPARPAPPAPPAPLTGSLGVLDTMTQAVKADQLAGARFSLLEDGDILKGLQSLASLPEARITAMSAEELKTWRALMDEAKSRGIDPRSILSGGGPGKPSASAIEEAVAPPAGGPPGAPPAAPGAVAVPAPPPTPVPDLIGAPTPTGGPGTVPPAVVPATPTVPIPETPVAPTVTAPTPPPAAATAPATQGRSLLDILRPSNKLRQALANVEADPKTLARLAALTDEQLAGRAESLGVIPADEIARLQALAQDPTKAGAGVLAKLKALLTHADERTQQAIARGRAGAESAAEAAPAAARAPYKSLMIEQDAATGRFVARDASGTAVAEGATLQDVKASVDDLLKPKPAPAPAAAPTGPQTPVGKLLKAGEKAVPEGAQVTEPAPEGIPGALWKALGAAPEPTAADVAAEALHGPTQQPEVNVLMNWLGRHFSQAEKGSPERIIAGKGLREVGDFLRGTGRSSPAKVLAAKIAAGPPPGVSPEEFAAEIERLRAIPGAAGGKMVKRGAEAIEGATEGGTFGPKTVGAAQVGEKAPWIVEMERDMAAKAASEAAGWAPEPLPNLTRTPSIRKPGEFDFNGVGGSGSAMGYKMPGTPNLPEDRRFAYDPATREFIIGNHPTQVHADILEAAGRHGGSEYDRHIKGFFHAPHLHSPAGDITIYADRVFGDSTKVYDEVMNALEDIARSGAGPSTRVTILGAEDPALSVMRQPLGEVIGQNAYARALQSRGGPAVAGAEAGTPSTAFGSVRGMFEKWSDAARARAASEAEGGVKAPFGPGSLGAAEMGQKAPWIQEMEQEMAAKAAAGAAPEAPEKLGLLRRFLSEDTGSISQPAAFRLMGAATGAGLGYLTDPLGDPYASAAAGASIGMLAPEGIKAITNTGANKALGDAIKNVPATAENIKSAASRVFHAMPQVLRFNYLADGYGLPANAVAGPWGSAFMAAIESALKGEARGRTALRDLADLPGFFKQMKDNWRVAAKMIGRAEGTPMSEAPSATERILASPGTIMTSGDITARNILIKNGFTEEEARAITLTSEPELEAFKALANLGKKSPLLQLLFPFRRTPANIAEQGAMRIPGLGFMVQAARQAPDPIKTQIIQQALGGATGFGAYEAGKNVDPETAKVLRRYLTNLGGQYSLPVAIGFTAGQATRHGAPLGKALISEVPRSIPLPTTQILSEYGKLATEGKLPRGFLPGVLQKPDWSMFDEAAANPYLMIPGKGYTFRE